MALITFELYVIKTFSIGNWSNFGSLVISTALLGFGISGTLLTFLQKKISKNPGLWLYLSSLLFMITMALSHIIAQRVPFNPIFIGTRSSEILYIGLYYILYGIPFFFGAAFVGISFMALEKGIYRLYFWNMLGSGLGGLALIIFMYILAPAALILPVLAIVAVANFIVAIEKDNNKNVIKFKKLAISLAGFILTIVLVFIFGEIRVSEYKAISYVRKYPDKQEAHHSFGPAGELHVYASSYFHFAPGLSDNAIFALDEMPTQPFWALYSDGNGPIGIMGKVEEKASAYMDYLPMAAPYEILQNPKNLLVNLGGGINAQIARHKGAREITIFEQNPAIIDLLADNPIISEFTGNLLDDERITVHNGETRAYCSKHPGEYDLVEISLIDSIGMSDSGGYPIVENFTYTEEAISEYMKALNPEGILSITVWNRLNPPRNVLKIISTIVSSLRKQGIENPEKRIFMFDLFLSTATILVKNSDFTEGEIYDLQRFCSKCSFNTIYYPGIAKKNIELQKILDIFRDFFQNNNSQDGAYSFTNSDVYHLVLMNLLVDEKGIVLNDFEKALITKYPNANFNELSLAAMKKAVLPVREDFDKPSMEERDIANIGEYKAAFNDLYPDLDFKTFQLASLKDYLNDGHRDLLSKIENEHWKQTEKKLYADYIFDIRPMTDSRPYYSGYLKINEIGMYMDNMKDISEEWAYILILGILAQAILFGGLIILIPVITRWKDLFKKQKGIIRIILYYSCLGMGYMLIEIFLIQRFVFFLNNPIYSTSIVITSMLIISGIGNLASKYIYKNNSVMRVRIACIGIALSLIFYIFLLTPILSLFRAESMFIRIIFSILLIAPSAFFMGMPFPNGLSALTENRPRLLPWAWGMNGGLSVAGSALANLISVSSGYTLLLIISIAVYVMVAFMYPANEIKKA